MGCIIYVLCGSVHTAPRQQSHRVLLQFIGLRIGVGVCVGVGQCEQTIKRQTYKNGFYGNKWWCSYLTFAFDGKDQRKTETQALSVNKA